MPAIHNTKSQVTITYDSQDISSQVLNINDFWSEEQGTAASDGFGSAWPEALSTGKAKLHPIELSGIFQAGTAASVDNLMAGQFPLSPAATAKVFKLTLIDATDVNEERSIEVDTHIVKYAVVPNREGGLTRWSATLQPTGEPTISSLEAIE